MASLISFEVIRRGGAPMQPRRVQATGPGQDKITWFEQPKVATPQIQRLGEPVKSTLSYGRQETITVLDPFNVQLYKEGKISQTQLYASPKNVTKTVDSELPSAVVGSMGQITSENRLVGRTKSGRQIFQRLQYGYSRPFFRL